MDILNRKKKIVLEPDHSSISASFVRNIEDIRSDIVTVIGAEDNIIEIETESQYENSTETSTPKVISCGDKDVFRDRVSTITKTDDMWSSVEKLLVAEKLGTLTNSEASIMHKKERLPGNYMSYKKTVKERKLINKIERLCKFLSITNKEELKNVFKFNQKN